MHKLTAADLVDEIAQLGTTRVYDYVTGRTKIQIVEIVKPEGPIRFIRWVNNADGSTTKKGSISSAQLTKMALACANKPNYPLHMDRLFSAGGNSRSALETLLAYTPHFFICYPKRVDSYTGEIREDLKHIMWQPEDVHPLGQIAFTKYSEDISELEVGVEFGEIKITADMLGDDFDSIDAKRIHTQMQIALIEIGNALNFSTWIAKNDRHIPVRDTTLGDLPGVIPSLTDMNILYNKEIKKAASLIDCIWFTNDGNRLPAVIEIEHSTGVTSGLTRMQKFKEAFPALATTFTIVAPNELRAKVINEANQKIFQTLKARFMPYSTVRELYGLVKRYHLTNVVDHTFVYPFMEQVVEN